MSPTGLLQVVFWLGTAGMLMILTAVALWQPLRPNPFQPGAAWISWDWWLRPVERNAFLRLKTAGDGFTTLHVSRDGQHLWAAGGGGRIVHSEDGGATWDPSASGTTNDLNEIRFLDERHGWAVGAGNTILRTTNGGGNWRRGDDSAVRVVEPEAKPERKAEQKGAPQKAADASSPVPHAIAALAGLPPNVMGQARPPREQRTLKGKDTATPFGQEMATAETKEVPRRAPPGPIAYTHVSFVNNQFGVAVGQLSPTNAVGVGSTYASGANPIPLIALSTNGGVTWLYSKESSRVADSMAPLWLSPPGLSDVSPDSVGTPARIDVVGFRSDGNTPGTFWYKEGGELVGEFHYRPPNASLPPFRTVKTDSGGLAWFLPDVRLQLEGKLVEHTAGIGSYMFGRIAQATPPFELVNDFDISSSNSLIFVGANGRIAITSTNGTELKSLTVSPPVSLRAVVFAGLNGWTVGGHHFFTTDDTVTWRACPLPPKRSPAPWYYVTLLLLGFTHVGLLRATWPKPVTVESIANRGVSDNPVTRPAADALRFGPMVEGISRFFRNPATVPPLTVAINGGWGMGKSSLMRLLQSDLKKYGVPTVWFNAWHHQNEESLFPPLLKHVTSQAVPGWWQFGGLHPVGWFFRARLLGRRVRVPELPTFAVLAVLGLAVAWLGRGSDARPGWSRENFSRSAASLLKPAETVAEKLAPSTTTVQLTLSPDAREQLGENFDSGEFLQSVLTGGVQVVLVQTNTARAAREAPGGHVPATTLFDFLGNALSGVAGVGSLWLLLRGLFGHLKAFGVDPAKLLHAAGDRMKPRDLEAKASFQIQFAGEFRDVTEALGNDQLVIFIDDLDRCSPDKVMQALEAVNFLVTSGKCFVVLGVAREQVESAMAHALGDVAELVTYEPEEIAQVKPAMPAPVTDEAREKENHRLKAIAYARRYMLKLVNIELEVPRAAAEAGRAMLQGGEKPVAAQNFWRPASVATMTACALILAGLLATRMPGTDPGDPSAVIAVEAKETNLISAAATTGATNPPAGAAPANGIVWTGPAREGAASPPLSTRRQWTWPGVFAAVLILAATAVLRSRRERQAKDSPDFLRALDVHWVAIDTLFPTPREKKRFINRVRYLAMRREESGLEKTYAELLSDWFRRRNGDDQLIAARREAEAKAAAHAIFLMLEKTMNAKSSALTPEFRARHLAEFESEPDPALRQEFDRFSNEIRVF